MNWKCKLGLHDWEVVGRGNMYVWVWCNTFSYFPKERIKEDCLWKFKRSKKKVCLNCNKCIDEDIIWSEKYKEQEKKREKSEQKEKQRKSLVKKMWENCKG